MQINSYILSRNFYYTNIRFFPLIAFQYQFCSHFFKNLSQLLFITKKNKFIWNCVCKNQPVHAEWSFIIWSYCYSKNDLNKFSLVFLFILNHHILNLIWITRKVNFEIGLVILHLILFSIISYFSILNYEPLFLKINLASNIQKKDTYIFSSCICIILFYWKILSQV